MTNEAGHHNVIFVLGIRRRSGTNYLGLLLSGHQDCYTARGIWEDQIVRELPRLEDYVQHLASQWPEHRREGLIKRLRLGLGRGITSMLAELDDAPWVWTKTPSVDGLAQVRDYFPDAAFVLIVRDGRAVAESARRTFGRGATLASEAAAWARAARGIRDFIDSDTGPHVLLRYEDLVRDPEAELRRLFSRLGMDPDRYDYAAVHEAPVKGSSTYHGDEDTGPHWRGVPNSSGFRPLERAASWSASRQRRYDAIAGAALEMFGYDRTAAASGPLQRLMDRLADAADRFVRWSWVGAHEARAFLGRLRRRLRPSRTAGSPGHPPPA